MFLIFSEGTSSLVIIHGTKTFFVGNAVVEIFALFLLFCLLTDFNFVLFAFVFFSWITFVVAGGFIFWVV